MICIAFLLSIICSYPVCASGFLKIKVPHPSYPSTCISIQVPNLCIHFSPERFCRIMELLSILPRLWKYVISLRLIVYTPNLLLGVGIGNSVATWQTCFLVLSGSYLYVFETAESQSCQRYLRAWIIGSGNGEDRIAPLPVLSSSFKK
ncbi:hypothetical protein Ahy_B04g072461 [Arachis hypogaea]|uniref:Uncharacterized protein n=1 Tax=Arachis hypogaea TaxID=3818 RepID=A0A444ZN40_ARAHY|nr:hypothetical protein Ahy_B04g072461 [Arachis hypogaea]